MVRGGECRRKLFYGCDPSILKGLRPVMESISVGLLQVNVVRQWDPRKAIELG